MNRKLLNRKWEKRLKDTDEDSISHRLINEFLVDIEWLRVEETDEIRENIRETGKLINLGEDDADT